eukprot:g9218.t1
MEDYEVTRAIGKGKFSTVYWAKRKEDGTSVALKKMSKPAMDEESRTKCMQEARLLQSLDHSNIIRFLDCFFHGACERDKTLVIVFEWAAAGDLKRQVRKALERQVHFKEATIWGYFAQICAAVSYMHQQRIMHRDLKPANIFLTLKGQVKVGDLGLGRFMTTCNETLAYSKVGTPLYTSPEVLRGGGYSWKSDIWSLGCILYELAMLRNPFKCEGLDLFTLVLKISRGNYPPVLDYYSEDLRALARDMININPPDRPSAEETHTVAVRMKERIDSLGQPINPPETAAHLKPRTPSTQKETKSENGRGEKGKDRDVDRTQGTAARGANKDGGHPAAQARAGQAPAESLSSRPLAPGAPAAGGAAIGTRGGVCDSAPTIDTPDAPRSGPVDCRSTTENQGTSGDDAGGDGSNFSDANQHRRQRRRHHHHHHHHHNNSCPVNTKDNNNNNNKSWERRRPKGEIDHFGRRQHQRPLHRLHRHHQHDQRDGRCAPQAAGYLTGRCVTSGNSRNGEVAATEAGVSKTGGAGPAGMEALGGAVAAASTNTGAATVVQDNNHLGEQRPTVATASQLAVDHAAPPPSLTLPSVVVMNARGTSLPQVRTGTLSAKAKAAKAAAEAAAAAATAAAAASAAEATPVVLRSKEVAPNKANGGGDPSRGQLGEAAGEWEVAAPPAVRAWGQPPPSGQGARVPQHGRRPHHAARSHDDTREASPAAATAAVANVVARGSPLRAVVVGRRVRRTNNENNTTTSAMTTTSSSSPQSSPRGLRGQEGETNPGSPFDGRRGENRGGGGGDEDAGVCPDGPGKERNVDVEMMMTAETNSGGLKDGDDGDDDDHQDDEDNSNRRRVKERRERRRKKINLHTKLGNHNYKHNHNHIYNWKRFKSSSPSVLRSPCAVGGDVRAEGARLKPTGTISVAAPTTTPGRVRERSSSQRRRRAGSPASPCAGAATAVATKAEDRSRVVAVAPGSTDQPASVSGDNLVAMEALLDRLSILGYENALRVRNEPPLTRLHFVVPGGSDDSSEGGGDGDGDGDGDGGGGGDGGSVRVKFPSRRKQFLGFIAVSEWLLQQLGSGVVGGVGGDGRGGAPTATPSPGDAPTAVCVNIIRGCQGLGFKPRDAGGEATAVCPANLAVGSGRAVLELLDWLSKAALKKMGEENASGEEKPTTQDGEGQSGQEWEEEDKQKDDNQDERSAKKGGEGQSRFVRHDSTAAAGKPAAPDGRGTGRWRGRDRGSPCSSTAGCLSNGSGSDSNDGGGGGDCGDCGNEEGPQASSKACVMPESRGARIVANSPRSIMKPTADPDAWRSEQQRVATKLAEATAAQKGQVGDINDSRAHRLGVLGSVAAAIARETVDDNPPPLPEAPAVPLPTGEHGEDSGGSGGSARHDNKTANVPRGRRECLDSMLTGLGGDVSRQLELLAAGEEGLNGSRQRSEGRGGGGGGRRRRLREEALLLRTQETVILAEIADRRDRVAALTEELCDAEDAVEEINEKLVDAADKYSDPTRLCKMRAAIRQLKADIKALDVLVGVNSAALMGKQLGRRQAAWRGEERAPVGSRLGGLHARAYSRTGSRRGSTASRSTQSRSSATSASSTTSSPRSTATTAPISAATTMTLPTSGTSTSSSGEECDGTGGGGNGSPGECSVAQPASRPPPTDKEKVWSSTNGVNKGQGFGSRRSSVLIQEAARWLASKPVVVPACGGGQV